MSHPIKESRPYSFLRKVYYSLKNYDETKEAYKITRNIRRFKNIGKGKPCVVIGNGPSLRIEDLTKMHELNIDTFACNRIHLVFSKTPWRPTYYFMSDEKLLESDRGVLKDAPDAICFYPEKAKDKVSGGNIYHNLLFDYENEGHFSTDAAKGVYAGSSVTTEMLQFAYYLGYNEIYMIGVDFSYNTTQKNDDRTYTYSGEKNYFIEGYMKPGEVADMPNIRANLLAFQAAREEVEKNGRIIMNATRGGKLEVFERVSLDELFERWEREN
ncbi:MAG: DUF115 domain-containing protein [Parasporobacterium sp.]|nr:DUF115 domain-containing protein [Parasporobacterium sp.]